MLPTGLPHLVFSIPYQEGFAQFVQQKNLQEIGIKKLLCRTVYVQMNLNCDVCVTHGVPLKLEESTS